MEEGAFTSMLNRPCTHYSPRPICSLLSLLICLTQPLTAIVLRTRSYIDCQQVRRQQHFIHFFLFFNTNKEMNTKGTSRTNNALFFFIFQKISIHLFPTYPVIAHILYSSAYEVGQQDTASAPAPAFLSNLRPHCGPPVEKLAHPCVKLSTSIGFFWWGGAVFLTGPKLAFEA